MMLLALEGDAVSLEFDPGEREAVCDKLRALGSLSIVHENTFDRITVLGEEFTYLDEWDQPCLISSTSGGSKLLRSIIDASDGLSLAAE